MIRVVGLTVAFGGIRPLDDLDADLTAVRAGIIGPNGAGKTTLLDVISGFVRPVAGRIFLDDTRLEGLSPVRRAAIGLRRTFQQEQVVGKLTVWENVQATADHISTPGCAKREIRRAIDFVGLCESENMLGGLLNLFERRMVEIAKTLIGRPRVILLDEPAAGLDEAETERLRHLLVKVPLVFGAQVILIDHDTDLIAALCTETMVLDFGRRLALGPTRAVLDDPAVRRAYLGGF